MEEPKGEKALLLVDGTCYFAPLERDRLSVRAAPKWLERLSEKIADRWSLSIARIHLFDAVMDSSLHDFPSHRKADKSRKSLLRNMQQAHIAVHFRYLKPFRTNCEDVNCRYKSAAIEVPVGAGVDVAITTFALADMPTDVKTVVLFVTDPDYAPLIRALKGKGTRVLVVTDSDAALDPALRDALDEHNPTPFIISLEELEKWYPTLMAANLEPSQDVLEREAMIRRNPTHRDAILRASSVEEARRFGWLAQDDINTLFQLYPPHVVDAVLRDPRCPRDFMAVLEFIDEILAAP